MIYSKAFWVFAPSILRKTTKPKKFQVGEIPGELSESPETVGPASKNKSSSNQHCFSRATKPMLVF